MSKNTVPILFSGGSYGTFIEWCLNYFSGQVNSLPFNLNGNSHQFVGNHLGDIGGWRKYVRSTDNFPFVRFHIKNNCNDSVITNTLEVLSTVDIAILLYHTDTSVLLSLNNKFEKIYSHGWLAHNEMLFAENLAKFEVSSLKDTKPWQLREFLSLFLYKQHQDETNAVEVEKFTHPKLIKIDIRDLFNNFETTIKSLLTKLHLPLIRNDFDFVYRNWLPLQQHQNKDKVVKQIIDSVINQNNFDWSSEKLSIVDEAIVQMRLRDLHNLDMLCYNLNEFPSNTTELRKVLIND